jgi:hypothetical protein
VRNGLVEGVSLRAVLRESGAMAPEAAASVLAGMLVTLAVVHGDVRPEHVRVDGSGGLALTDFGAADTEFVPNVPTYLAPERLEGAAATPAGDVFSATAVFFECLTNESPFVAKTREDLAALYEYSEVIAEFATPELRTVAQHGLAPTPARRPASPHDFLDEVTTAASEAYGPDWQQHGRALLSGWAAAAAAAEGVELAAPAGRETAAAGVAGDEAPPVGEPIDESLLALDADDELTVANEDAEEMPPPFGEPIDASLLDAGADPVAAEPEHTSEPAPEPETSKNADYDWFTGGPKEGAGTAADDPLGAEADVLAAFDDARAGRAAESTPTPYTPTGFDVFANGSSSPAAEAEAEPVTGHWDLGEESDAEDGAEPEGSSLLAGFDALDEAEDADVEQSSDAAEVDESGEESSASEESDDLESLADDADIEPVAEDSAGLLTAFDTLDESDEEGSASDESDLESLADEADIEPVAEDSAGLLAAFDAFAPSPAADATEDTETETPAEEDAAAESEADSDSDSDPDSAAGSSADADSEAEPLPKRDPFAGLGLEMLAAGSIVKAEPPASPEAEPEAETEPEPDPEPATDPEPEPDPEPEEPQPAPRRTPRTDLEDDWVIPAKPSPKAPRSLSAYALSLPSMPRPKTDAEPEEPKPPVQTSAPDDWFRPGVTTPAGGDAQHTQVLNPESENTVEREATRTFDQVSDEAPAPAAAAAADGDGDDDDGGDAELVGPGIPGGPRRKTVVGAVATAVLLVAGAAAVVLGGSGKPSQGPSGAPTESTSSSPSPTAVPTTPVGTSDAASSTASSSTPSSHHSSTHSRSRSSSSPSHSAGDTTSHTSASETPTATSSSSNPSGGQTSSTCPPGILGIPICPTTSSHGAPTDTGSTGSTSSTSGAGGN